MVFDLQFNNTRIFKINYKSQSTLTNQQLKIGAVINCISAGVSKSRLQSFGNITNCLCNMYYNYLRYFIVLLKLGSNQIKS